jgi:tetratricopeptide (TPR) repeat protein
MKCLPQFVVLVSPLAILAWVSPAQAQHSSRDYYNQGLALANAGKQREAISAFSSAIQLDGRNTAAYTNRAMAWSVLSDYDKAMADCNEAIRLDPNYGAAYAFRGSIWYRKGDCDRATDDCNAAIRLLPTYAPSYNIRALAWNAKGEYGRAIADCLKSLQLDPNGYGTYDRLARIEAICPDKKYRNGRAAFENASKACQLTGAHDWACVSTLAAAYAECGDFEKAKLWQNKAIALNSDESDKAACRVLLELYNQRKPYPELPYVQATGWIEASNFTAAIGNGVGANPSQSFTTPRRYDILRCPDGHDYVLARLTNEPVTTGLTTSRAKTYRIAGRATAIPPSFWPDVTAYFGNDGNPFQDVTKPDGTTEHREVSKLLLVQTIRTLTPEDVSPDRPKAAAQKDSKAAAVSELAVGDAVVTRDRCILQNGHATTALPKGVQVRIIALNGEWVGCSILIDGKEEIGWIKRQLIAKTPPTGDTAVSPATSSTDRKRNDGEWNASTDTDAKRAATVSDITPGGTVVVVENTRLMLGQRSLAEVPRGVRLQVKTINGDWVGVVGVVGGKEQNGWIERRMLRNEGSPQAQGTVEHPRSGTAKAAPATPANREATIPAIFVGQWSEIAEGKEKLAVSSESISWQRAEEGTETFPASKLRLLDDGKKIVFDATAIAYWNYATGEKPRRAIQVTVEPRAGQLRMSITGSEMTIPGSRSGPALKLTSPAVEHFFKRQ